MQSTNDSSPTQLYTSEILDNGVWSFVFLSSDHKAVDEYYAYLDEQYRILPPTAVLLCLLNTTQSKVPSLNYVIQGARKLMKNHSIQPKTRHAVLANPDPLLNIAMTLLRLLRLDATQHAVRFFHGDQRDEAIAWLLATTTVKDNEPTMIEQTL